MPLPILVPALFLGGVIFEFILDLFEEPYVRQKETSIRAAKAAYVSIREENYQIAQHIRKVRRGQLEYLRRGALIGYHKHRLAYLHAIKKDLEEAKQQMYDRVSAINHAVKHAPNRKYIEGNVWQEFHVAKANVHNCIAQAKEIEVLLYEQIVVGERERTRLTDGSTHNRLGGKKAIGEFLDSTQAYLQRVYQKPNRGELVLPFGGTHLILDVRCEYCRARLAPEMHHCFVCGTATEQGIDLSPEPTFASGIPCTNCAIDVDESFMYCFNCGARHDPFGLRAAYEA